MKTAYIGLGGNQGAMRNSFRYALKRLEQEGCFIKAVSSLYKTPAWGKKNQPDFLNACIKLETELPPQELLRLSLRIEKERGRERLEKWGPRSLDIDILIYDGFKCAPTEKCDLALPHSLITERAFVILPLSEIAPDIILEGETVAQWVKFMRKSGEAEGIEKAADAAQWIKGI